MKKQMFSLLAFLFLLNCEKDFSPFEYNDTCCHFGEHVRKPNIYIYPPEPINLTVNISFPNGGEITESIPPYKTGWDIFVNESGLIDNEFEYLFYESLTPDLYQYQYGWIIEKEQLTNFFTENMTEYGFNEKEIKDFITYWIPLLNSSNMFAIYPQTEQTIEQIIKLNFSIKPNSILRLFYIIKTVDESYSLQCPQIDQFERSGFTVAEWGVVIK